MIKFDKNMEVGVKLIDDQHQELISRINAFVGMGVKSYSPEETRKMLDSLGSYIRKHFSDEQNLHLSVKYPEATWHKGQHALYIKEFEELYKEYNNNGISTAFTLKLTNSIIGWIVKHIKSADVQFGKFHKSLESKS